MNAMQKAHEIRRDVASKLNCKISEINFSKCLQLAHSLLRKLARKFARMYFHINNILSKPAQVVPGKPTPLPSLPQSRPSTPVHKREQYEICPVKRVETRTISKVVQTCDPHQAVAWEVYLRDGNDCGQLVGIFDDMTTAVRFIHQRNGIILPDVFGEQYPYVNNNCLDSRARRKKMYDSLEEWKADIIAEKNRIPAYDAAHKILKTGDRISVKGYYIRRSTITFSHWAGCWLISKMGNEYCPTTIKKINGKKIDILAKKRRKGESSMNTIKIMSTIAAILLIPFSGVTQSTLGAEQSQNAVKLVLADGTERAVYYRCSGSKKFFIKKMEGIEKIIIKVPASGQHDLLLADGTKCVVDHDSKSIDCNWNGAETERK